MRKYILLLLVSVLCIAALAGCGKANIPETAESALQTENAEINAESVEDTLQLYMLSVQYKNKLSQTVVLDLNVREKTLTETNYDSGESTTREYSGDLVQLSDFVGSEVMPKIELSEIPEGKDPEWNVVILTNFNTYMHYGAGEKPEYWAELLELITGGKEE